MDGFFVCAALETHYVVYNVATGISQDLFPIEPDTNPVMIRIAKVFLSNYIFFTFFNLLLNFFIQT